MSLQVIAIYANRVWIEDDILGAKHVMVQSEAPGCEPFCYCTFNYDYAYTSNSTIVEQAERVALSIGATHPIEHRHRRIDWSNAALAAKEE